jgi:hypothetical protein
VGWEPLVDRIEQNQMTITLNWPHACALVAAAVITSGTAVAQTLTNPPTAAAASPGAGAVSNGDDDDAALRPLEPDFTVINLPTTLPLPLHGGSFHLTHRSTAACEAAASVRTRATCSASTKARPSASSTDSG